MTRGRAPAAWVLALAAGLLLPAGCYRGPSADGPYRCDAEGQCPGERVCDDGLCCIPGGSPACVTLPGPDGTCASGAALRVWYLDADGDGFGDPNSSRSGCAQPQTVPGSAPGAQWVNEGGDCNDDDVQVHPAAVDVCDGVDNNCDGQVDEGHLLVDLWPDRDNDGYGDASATPIQRCGEAPGLVSRGGDCNDADARVHPGAPELCNGRDDDCDGAVDEDAAESGRACLDPVKKGACQSGLTACSDGAVVCVQSATFPRAERCSGLDDDCNGLVDDQPGCGGPTNLLGAGVTKGAKSVGGASGNNGIVTSCQKDAAGTSRTFTGSVWSGVSGGTQIGWVEKTTGTWDLRKARLGLRLHATFSLNNNGSWSDFGQPMILLCGPNDAFVRYRVPASASRLGQGTVTINELIPFATGGDWFSTDARTDLAAIHRVELLIQPNLTSPAPDFTVTFQALGFEVMP